MVMEATLSSDADELLTTSAVAKLIDRSPDWVRHLDRVGKLRAQRTSTGIRLFRRHDVEELLRGEGR